MKKIFSLCIMLCFCCAFVSAENISGTYIGSLMVTVDTETPSTVPNVTVTAVDNGDTITLTIVDFTYQNISCGDIVVTVKKKADGTFNEILTITAGWIPVDTASINGQISDGNCTLSLSVSALFQTINIDYTGIK